MKQKLYQFKKLNQTLGSLECTFNNCWFLLYWNVCLNVANQTIAGANWPENRINKVWNVDFFPVFWKYMFYGIIKLAKQTGQSVVELQLVDYTVQQKFENFGILKPRHDFFWDVVMNWGSFRFLLKYMLGH